MVSAADERHLSFLLLTLHSRVPKQDTSKVPSRVLAGCVIQIGSVRVSGDLLDAVCLMMPSIICLTSRLSSLSNPHTFRDCELLNPNVYQPLSQGDKDFLMSDTLASRETISSLPGQISVNLHQSGVNPPPQQFHVGTPILLWAAFQFCI